MDNERHRMIQERVREWAAAISEALAGPPPPEPPLERAKREAADFWRVAQNPDLGDVRELHVALVANPELVEWFRTTDEREEKAARVKRERWKADRDARGQE